MYGNRGTFPDPSHNHETFKQNRLAKLNQNPRQSINWTQYCEPGNTLVTDPVHGTLAHWWSCCPDYGRVPCFPVSYDLSQMDCTYHLRDFALQIWSPKNLKYFKEGFPQLPKEHNSYKSTMPTTIIQWWHAVVTYCKNYCVFVPPLHTLREGYPFGIWWGHVPPLIQENTISAADVHIAECLRSMYVGFTMNTIFSSMLHTAMQSSIELLYQIAIIIRHPWLVPVPDHPKMPIQDTHMSLMKYVHM